MIPFVRCQLPNQADFSIYIPILCTWLPKNKRIDNIFPVVLDIVILDILIQHLGLVLYGYCENVEREIKATRSLRDHTGPGV